MPKHLIQFGAILLTLASALLMLSAPAQETVFPERVFGFGFISQAVFSPDGTKVLFAHRGVASMLDVASGASLLFFVGHPDHVLSVAFSPDGTYVLTGSFDNTAKLWNTSTGRLLRTYVGHTEGVNSVAFSPDGTRREATRAPLQAHREAASSDSRRVWLRALLQSRRRVALQGARPRL